MAAERSILLREQGKFVQRHINVIVVPPLLAVNVNLTCFAHVVAPCSRAEFLDRDKLSQISSFPLSVSTRDSRRRSFVYIGYRAVVGFSYNVYRFQRTAVACAAGRQYSPPISGRAIVSLRASSFGCAPRLRPARRIRAVFPLSPSPKIHSLSLSLSEPIDPTINSADVAYYRFNNNAHRELSSRGKTFRPSNHPHSPSYLPEARRVDKKSIQVHSAES